MFAFLIRYAIRQFLARGLTPTVVRTAAAAAGLPAETFANDLATARFCGAVEAACRPALPTAATTPPETRYAGTQAEVDETIEAVVAAMVAVPVQE